MADGYFSFTVQKLEFESWCGLAVELWERFLEDSFRLARRRAPGLTRNAHEAAVTWEIVHSPLPFSRYVCDFLDYVAPIWLVQVDWEWATSVPAGGSWIWCEGPATYVICASCSDPRRLGVFDNFRRTRILLHELAHIIDPFLSPARANATRGDWLSDAPAIVEIRGWWFAFEITKLIQGAYSLFHRKKTGSFSDDQTANAFL